jgi:hypothetical protein
MDDEEGANSPIPAHSRRNYRPQALLARMVVEKSKDFSEAAQAVRFGAVLAFTIAPLNCMTRGCQADSLTINPASEHQLCLDMLKVTWRNSLGNPTSDCAILLEIWNTGGLVQVTTSIPPGSMLEIKTKSTTTPARVISCEQDDFGFVVRFASEDAKSWFPNSYQPPYTLP